MLIRIDGKGGVSLEDPEDFTRFSILAAPGISVADALNSIALVEGHYAWVAPDAVRRLAPKSNQRDWDKNFKGMLDYAERKGWMNSDGAVRAHIEKDMPQ